VIYLTSYDYLKSIYPSKDGGGGSNFVRDFGAGIGAETLACIVYVPVDVVKERMQVSGGGTGDGGRGGAGNEPKGAVARSGE